jgi:hypothetical protein
MLHAATPLFVNSNHAADHPPITNLQLTLIVASLMNLIETFVSRGPLLA